MQKYPKHANRLNKCYAFIVIVKILNVLIFCLQITLIALPQFKFGYQIKVFEAWNQNNFYNDLEISIRII